MSTDPVLAFPDVTKSFEIITVKKGIWWRGARQVFIEVYSLLIKKKRLHESVTSLQHKVLNSLYEFSQGERRPFSYVGHGDERMVGPTFRLSQGDLEYEKD
jgi:hypothetical protein